GVFAACGGLGGALVPSRATMSLSEQPAGIRVKNLEVRAMTSFLVSSQKTLVHNQSTTQGGDIPPIKSYDWPVTYERARARIDKEVRWLSDGWREQVEAAMAQQPQGQSKLLIPTWADLHLLLYLLGDPGHLVDFLTRHRPALQLGVGQI